MLERVQSVLEKIRPALQMDGGDIELVALEEGGILKVRLQGACQVCPSIGMTMQHAIERAVKEELPEVRQVINISSLEEIHA